jgi:hypothetical protein
MVSGWMLWGIELDTMVISQPHRISTVERSVANAVQSGLKTLSPKNPKSNFTFQTATLTFAAENKMPPFPWGLIKINDVCIQIIQAPL